ncbi:hydroxyacylglutathione hydrolase [Maudiozyma humilis]|uniref:hydroxyacylglutathione hydrolase n=1 Tax=Maudiozyma humilis TaxID=51915 RepID=A0AAV5RSF2_MAUHU|nr:hydroxyacylglutathione hydrolase [Kazachstania humilis]
MSFLPVSKAHHISLLHRFIRRMHIKPIKMRWATGGDNYAYLVSSQDKGSSWLIDPAEPLEVLPNLDQMERRSIKAIVNTHHHYDHSGGNVDILRELKGNDDREIKVIAGSHVSPGATTIPVHRDPYTIGDLHVTCIRTPCHTGDSICYYIVDKNTNEHAIFTGDTLFTAGCGRFFEGTGQEMDTALNSIILQVVGEPNWGLTKVYPGHEYTKSNARFVREAVYQTPGQNEAFDKLEEFANTHKVTTGHFTLADELAFNPFMRLNDPKVRTAAGDKTNSRTTGDVMAKLREMKNRM